MTRVVLIGPPGVGKGTQAVRLAAELGVPAISTGDIFRDNIARKTPLGVELRDLIQSGEYVPDATTNAIVADRLAQSDCDAGFILDGYPRTRPQVDELDRILANRGDQVDAVIELRAPTNELVRRLVARASEQNRLDDTPGVIRRRIEVYERETADLVGIYAARGLVSRVDATGTREVVGEKLAATLRALP